MRRLSSSHSRVQNSRDPFLRPDDPPRKRPPERGVKNEDIECVRRPPKSLWRRGDSGRVHAEGRPPNRPLPGVLRPGTDEAPRPAGRETGGRRIAPPAKGHYRGRNPPAPTRARGRKRGPP